MDVCLPDQQYLQKDKCNSFFFFNFILLKEKKKVKPTGIVIWENNPRFFFFLFLFLVRSFGIAVSLFLKLVCY